MAECTKTPLVGILMGSNSDWDVMKNAAQMLKDFGVPFEARVVSAHRMPDEMFEYAEKAAERGIRVIIAGAGGAAHLPGMLAAKCTLPVCGVPVRAWTVRVISGVVRVIVPRCSVALHGGTSKARNHTAVLARSSNAPSEQCSTRISRGVSTVSRQ